jgi:hypothetical protein
LDCVQGRQRPADCSFFTPSIPTSFPGLRIGPATFLLHVLGKIAGPLSEIPSCMWGREWSGAQDLFDRFKCTLAYALGIMVNDAASMNEMV